jgi:AraC family transcriptional regulator
MELKMDWIERLNKAVSYMEEHMTEEIDFVEAAIIACCSSYQFQRMFSYLADVSLSEYIRRRKMSLAAVDLQSNNTKVIDIALKYGYSSPTAFNRAFQSIHGIAPSRIKDDNITLKSYLPLNFVITVKGVEEMNFRIEQKEAFRVVGITHPLEKELEKNFEIVPQMWIKAITDGTMSKLREYRNGTPKGMIGLSVSHHDWSRSDYDNWRYFIAVPSTLDKGEYEEYTIPAFTWAVFPGKGEYAIDAPNLERRIITEWLPSSGYEYADGPDIEVFYGPDINNSEFEIWIPIQKKN